MKEDLEKTEEMKVSSQELSKSRGETEKDRIMLV